MTDRIQPPKDGVRAMPPGSMTGDGKTLFGRLAPVNEWAEIRSVREGHFLERHAPGAFSKTFKETTPKILFQHGRDNLLGDRIIAQPIELGEDEVGPFYRAELLDGLDPLLVEGLKRNLYGSSHTFQAVREDKMVYPKEPTAWNPDMLPERTIREVRVPEMGPVTWPAYLGSATSARSLSDEFALSDVAAQPERLADLVSYVSPVAPSVDAGAEPHLEPERREADPPPPVEAASIKETQDPPTGGSLSTRKEPTPVDYISREDKASRVKELESAIEARANEFTGVFPEDIQKVDDADIAERDQLIRDIAAVDARAQRIASFGNDEKRTESTYSAPAVNVIRTRTIEDIYDVRAVERGASTPEDRAQKLRDNAMRSIDSSYLPSSTNTDNLGSFIEREMTDEDADGRLHQEATRRVLLTGSPAYKRAFAKYLRYGNKDAWTPEENRAAALAVTGTTTTGGYAVPYIFDPTFIHIGAHTSTNPYRAACRVETISGGNNWRAVTATAITAKWDTEAAASVEGGPTIGQPTFTVQRADAFATVSIETLQDRPDVTEELSSLFGEAKDTLEENSFTLGTGATVYPFGMFRTLAFTAKATATSDVTVLLDLIAVEGDLPIRHRAKGAWFMSRSTQRQLELLDTTGYYFKRPGQFFAMGKAELVNSPTGNTGTQLLGYPVWEVPSAVSTLTTDAAQIAVFGDPKQYVIVDRVGLNVEVVPTMLNGATPSFPTGQRGIYCYWRSTARPLNVDGMRQLVVA
jgi:HK97 family phage major capsid protein